MEALCSPRPRPSLLDQPITDPQLTLFVYESSLIDGSGNCQAAYTVVTFTEMVEANRLPVGTSSQKAELIALTRAPHITKGQWANIYTDSK